MGQKRENQIWHNLEREPEMNNYKQGGKVGYLSFQFFSC